ncbi:rod shape-determining protein RodA [Panacibacter ginsenosidivorans]|uniref:Cell wall polymerase n=1 Tax=Panacibacter ginsenosidivorans TaxID=1813871 RepID=A0A5B8VAW5_9BACT|nr:rod shape-determining protein RodA [Panacibacter ginsenosidivorans]QEC68610.1 rod shape-determining protein RodA [Panacibacter ginsenosidivorans]
MANISPISKGVDWLVVWLYAILVAIGILCIFMVEYNPDTFTFSSFISFNTNYSKQLLFAGICAIVAIFILLSDSKLYTAFANLFYVFGIGLMFLTFVIGKDINGSKSWIPLGGGFNLQPAELCKIFTSLALAKYLSQLDLDFTKTKSQVIAAAIALSPAMLSIMQNETGLALAYSSFFIVMYREGLPGIILIIGFSVGALVVATLVMEPNTLAIILTVIAAGFIYFLRWQIKRNRGMLILIIAVWGLSVGIQRFAVPYVFNNVFQCYQAQRIYSMVGKDYDCSQNRSAKISEANDKKVTKPDDYNVRQSKIAIGSGGIIGKGFLKGTQTRGKYVPEQHTDFIFTSLGEAFGFTGCLIFLGLYFLLLFRIIFIAERQRSTFSRVYAYSIASIIFFHIAVNVCMTIGLFPIIGIPLPLISYGGSSLLTFTVLIFILVRLDADRQMVLR